VYLFYNRNFAMSHSLGDFGVGKQMTEIRVYPAGTLPPQAEPNT
jgi:hypothetical protein